MRTNKKKAGMLTAGLVIAVASLSLGVSVAGAAKTRIITGPASTLTSNETPRKTVLCPKKNPRFKFPYGGSSYSTSTYETDGAGVYPHSYERLGVQGGYHVTPVYYDPSPDAASGPKDVILQVVCGPEPGKLTPPHQTAQVDPGQVKTHTAVCPGRRQLIGGGFQRTTFVGPVRGAPPSGVFPTESLAIAPDTWRTSGEAFGKFGGELTNIAYCRRSKKPLLSEVSASVTVNPGQAASATTPPCPGGRRMVFSGFTTLPLGSIFFAGGPLNGNNTVTGTGYNRSLAPAILTVEGYCMNIQSSPKGKKR
jgi:hypothetical protein